MKRILVLAIICISFVMQTDEPEINKERLTVKNLTVGMLRALFEDEKADEKIKKFDVNYFQCDAQGLELTYMDGKAIADPQYFRSEIVIAFKEEGNPSIFALSHPGFLGDGWLVVSAKFKKPNNWIDIWDDEHNMTELDYRLINAVKGTVNDFVLRVDVEGEQPEDWVEIERGIFMTSVNTAGTVSMNRNTLSYFETSTEVRRLMVQEAQMQFEYVTKSNAEGTCTPIERE